LSASVSINAWHARVVKARTSAAALVEAGHVRVNGVREKAPGTA